MGFPDILPLPAQQVDAVPHPDCDDHQCPDPLSCRLLHHPRGDHSPSWPLLQPFKAEDV